MNVKDAIISTARWFVTGRSSLENPSTPLDPDYDSSWNGLNYHSRGSAGVRVTAERALGFHPVLRGIDLLSSTVGKLPLHRLRKVEGGTEHDTTHTTYFKLLNRPSAEMSALTWKKTMEAHRIMEGNGYTFCRRNGGAQITEFVLLDPTQTHPVRFNGELFYVTYTANGSPQFMSRTDVIHIKALSRNGLVGLPLWQVGNDSIGAGIATIEYGGRYFRNNAIPAIVIEVPEAMKDPAKVEALAKGWNKIHQGIENSHKTGVLTNGAKAHVLTATSNDAQLIEQKKFSIIEAANILGLPPHKLGDGSRTAYNSLEQENQSFLDDCLDWRLVDWEQELWDKVLTEKEKADDSHEIIFDRKQLLRADITAKGQYLSLAVGGPWMTVDEARRSEGMNDRPGEEGDVLYSPVTAAQTPDPSQANTDPNATPGTANAGVVTDITLNGAQVESARNVLLDVQLGHIADTAAIELLVGIGIERPRAEAMVAAQLKIPPPVVDPAAAPTPTVAPAAPAAKARQEMVDLVSHSCRRMADRIAKSAQRAGKKRAGFTDWIDSISDDHSAVIVAEFTPPLNACRAVCGVDIAPNDLARQLIGIASRDLGELADKATYSGLEGAVNEWATRFTGPSVEKLVGQLFTIQNEDQS